MIKQNKGKDLHKIASSKLIDKDYFVSKKYDGHYTQIVYDGQHVQFFTSGGKEFYLAQMADDIMSSSLDPFHVECEFNYSCKGKLGDRGKSAVLTTYRTNLSKGILTPGVPGKDIFRLLDRLDSDYQFQVRLESLRRIANRLNRWFYMPVQHRVSSIEEALMLSVDFYKEGYEGAMCKDPQHIYQPGKRTNDIIKLKPRKTADLKCIDMKLGTGKYSDMIGSLLLQDSIGREVWAGSGLNDVERDPHINYIGRVIEIEYETIDETYVQPIIKHIREDKEID